MIGKVGYVVVAEEKDKAEEHCKKAIEIHGTQYENVYAITLAEARSRRINIEARNVFIKTELLLQIKMGEALGGNKQYRATMALKRQQNNFINRKNKRK